MKKRTEQPFDEWDYLRASLMAPRRSTFRWTTMTGLTLELEEIADVHLLEIERFLMGHGEHPRPTDDLDVIRPTHAIILDEIERRGLQPLDGPHPSVEVSLAEEDRRETSYRDQMRRSVALDMATYGRVGPLAHEADLP